MKKIRTGIIGMGVMGSIFARCIEDLPYVELVAISDLNEKTVSEFSQKYRIKGYSDYKDMIAQEDLNAVLICTPDEYHLEPVKLAREANLHIFLEKPLATEILDAKNILSEAEKSSKVFMIGHTLRFDPRFVNGYNSIAKGDLGELIHIRSWRETSIDNGIRLKGRCSPVFFVGVHDIDIMNWYVGCPVKRVFANSVSKKLVSLGVETEDAIFATLEFENGVIANLETSWVLPKTQGQQRSNTMDKGMEVVGTSGMLSIDAYNIGMIIQTEKEIFYPDILFNPIIHGASFGIYREEMIHFFSCIAHDKIPSTTAQDAFNAVLVAKAIEDSVRSKKVIEIGDQLWSQING